MLGFDLLEARIAAQMIRRSEKRIVLPAEDSRHYTSQLVLLKIKPMSFQAKSPGAP
jgi:hypothetical protein